jgi:hypothetical protein
MHVHDEVLAAANQIASARGDWTFTPFEVVKALPILNENSVRTHIVSRCCVNAPRNHLHKWDYFRRVGHGKYEVLSPYRDTSALKISPTGSITAHRKKGSQASGPQHPKRRDVIHAVVHVDQDVCIAECLEVAVVTQGSTLDEVVRNLNDALALHLEGEDLAEFGLSDHPRLQLILETPLNR